MQETIKKYFVPVTLAAVVLLIAPVATARLWISLERGAYRSPVQVETEAFTPRMQWLEDRAAVQVERPATQAERASTPAGAAVAGAELFQANGCYACHSLEGERLIGPSLRGIFGTTVELSDGSTIPVDDTYLVESILQPEAKRVAGYNDAAMPSYEGLLSVEDAWELARYIKGFE